MACFDLTLILDNNTPKSDLFLKQNSPQGVIADLREKKYGYKNEHNASILDFDSTVFGPVFSLAADCQINFILMLSSGFITPGTMIESIFTQKPLANWRGKRFLNVLKKYTISKLHVHRCTSSYYIHQAGSILEYPNESCVILLSRNRNLYTSLTCSLAVWKVLNCWFLLTNSSILCCVDRTSLWAGCNSVVDLPNIFSSQILQRKGF